MRVNFPIEQRVLTREEYKALGYVEIGRVPTGIVSGQPITKPLINLPAYRAETKEEYAVDLAVGIVKVGYTVSTGGVVPAAKTALGYVTSLLN